ncbi:GAF and ANTAR domain-containing protein [Friedmanniella luteola]|uniref:GAF and ANTAR domain-containing protein n=1 Tax=Friedmanniella luteola TaxID=546871 RepID=UPI0018D4C493|nr:GAF and ANTAR domain-containing protein [Friedmanniella luteola]
MADGPAREDDDLRAGLAGLARLASADLGLETLLTRVAGFAVKAIPGAEGAGLTLLEGGRTAMVVVTAPFVREVDDVQYGIGEGPCITAAAEARTVVAGSLGSDLRWRRFGREVVRLGVHSVVSLPLVTPGGVLGAMNVYAHSEGVFDQRAAELGELFAAPAAVAVQNAHVLAQARRLVAQLQAALDGRVAVERAVGIVMSRGGVSEGRALERLRALSQHEGTDLVTVALSVVDEAVRTARTPRHG